MASIIPTTVTPATAAATTPAGTTTTSSSSGTQDTAMIASNFTTFLQLLTTQLKNQNPMDPLDTNQFTQQLVQFAQVEQQMKSNTQLQTLISLQQSAQATTALNYVGASVVLDGSNGPLTNSSATWNLNASKPATATIVIQDKTGQTVYSGTGALNAGVQPFVWNGIGNDGKQWPDGNYTISVVALDASKQPVPVSIETQGVVDSVDLTQNPPLLSIAGQTYTMDKIKRIVRSN
jgi:flagellar basal-body rod modification protein FlgD